MKYALIIFSIVLLYSCQQKATNTSTGHKIAIANGLKKFEKVQMLEFIFNVQRDTAAASSRHWQWFRASNEVVFLTDSSNIKFKRNDTTTQELKKLNARFTNDEYWLLFPYHLSWDKGFALMDSGMKTGPVTAKNLHKISVKYNNVDGYTPGDMYDVFTDEDNMIQEWSYHKGAAAQPSLMTTWEDYKDFNGMKIVQDHKSKDGKFRIWFTGIQIKYD